MTKKSKKKTKTNKSITPKKQSNKQEALAQACEITEDKHVQIENDINESNLLPSFKEEEDSEEEEEISSQRISSFITNTISKSNRVHANVKETGKDTMSSYLKSMGNHELLTHEDEIVLGTQIQTFVKWEEQKNLLQDELLREPSREEWATKINITVSQLQTQMKKSAKAKRALIEANLRLVVTIARQNMKYSTKINFQDACQEGIIGLIRACEKYDPTQGFRFSTYAHWWIKRQIKQSVADQHRIQSFTLPYHIQRQINKIKITEVTMRAEAAGKKPTQEQLAEKVEMSLEKLEYYQKLGQDAFSLDKQLNIKNGKGSKASSTEGTATTFQDLIQDEQIVSPTELTQQRMLQHDVRRLVSTLSPREQAVIRLRFGLDDGTPRTLNEIAQRFGVANGDRIRVIEARALNKLKQPYRNGSLKCYISDL